MNKIINKFTDKIICKGEESIKELAEKYWANLSGANLSGADLSRANLSEANLYGADLSRANLYGVDLSWADLSWANLSWASLSGADLSKANLSKANLYEADLSKADLYGANLSGADLSGADLSEAYLSEADLSGANLSGANLDGANLEFFRFPSIRLISSIQLGLIPNDLALELMRRDVDGHPYPEKFDEWAKGGDCPYQNEERFWLFNEKREAWKPGKPQMSDKDLIIAICKEKGWKIKNYTL